MSAKTEEPFLNVILANQDDDAPRLVFADWLDEEGDSDRAEFVRLQVQLARLPEWDAQALRLRLRESELLKQHERKWRSKLPKIAGIKWGEFRRGFLWKADFSSFAALDSKWSACRNAAPIEAVSIPWPRFNEEFVERISPRAGLRELSISDRLIEFVSVDELAKSPVLSTLQVLEIRERSLGTEGFRRIVASPHLKQLTALRVPFNSIGNGCTAALLNAAPMPSLTHLDLSEVGSYGRYGEDPIIQADGLSGLATWPGLARLTSLSLSGNDVHREGLRALLRSPFAVGLKELTLRGNGLNGQAMQEFEAARPELNLDVLDVGENLLRDVGPAYLAISNCLRELKVLSLDRCEVHLAGVRSLAKAPFLSTLRRLSFDENSIGPDGLLALLAKRPASLHTLSLANDDLGDEGAWHLANFPDLGALLDVNLASNGMSAKAAEDLGSAKHLENLQVLRLTDNQIGKKAATALAKSPLGKRLAVLEIDKD